MQAGRKCGATMAGGRVLELLSSDDSARAQLERDVADVVGRDHVHLATVWVAIGMLQHRDGVDERAALAYLSRFSAQWELLLHEVAALLISRQVCRGRTGGHPE